jgi:diguanylate cyclase (GGDEF)-like protein
LEVVREMRVDAGRQEPVKITISIGLARVHQNDATPDSFIARADAAMYQAKRNGRDRLEMAGKATA